MQERRGEIRGAPFLWLLISTLMLLLAGMVEIILLHSKIKITTRLLTVQHYTWEYTFNESSESADILFSK